jgi:hypothetical protein
VPNSERTNLSPFTKGCREEGALLRISKFFRTCVPQLSWCALNQCGRLHECGLFWFVVYLTCDTVSLLNTAIINIREQETEHTFSASWLWSSVVSVLISMTTDILPTWEISNVIKFLLGQSKHGILVCHCLCRWAWFALFLALASLILFIYLLSQSFTRLHRAQSFAYTPRYIKWIRHRCLSHLP